MAKRNEPEVDLKLGAEPPPERPDLDPDGNDLHPLLTNSEVLAARKKALADLRAEQRKEALANLVKTEKHRLALEEGLTVVGDGQKPVWVQINLPQFAACLTVNTVHKYFHGQQYKVPKHIADSLNEMMDRAWHHERLEIRGEKLREYYNSPHNTSVSPQTGVRGAPTMGGANKATLSGVAI